MAHCRAVIQLDPSSSPAEWLPLLLQAHGLDVEHSAGRALMACERPAPGRSARNTVRLWADWSDICHTGELWLETLSGESMTRRSTRCSEVFEQIRARLHG